MISWCTICGQNFVVEVIQFRNTFDAAGPGVPGTRPEEAARRLEEYRALYAQFENKHRVLDGIAKWFGVPIRQFADLERTGLELQLLALLYGLYTRFLAFEATFRETLWADVNLHNASHTVRYAHALSITVYNAHIL